jgi:PEP-CTERM motif
MRKRVVMLCVAVLFGTAQLARADAVYINSGYYVIGSSGDMYRFGVTVGDAFALATGSASSVAGISALTCLVCDPGTTYEIGRHTAGPGFLGEADLGNGTFTSGNSAGSSTSNFHFNGWLTFLADPIVLPSTGTADISFAIPFRARVSLDGSDLNNPGGGIFARWLGMGTAHVTFTPTSDGRWANNSGELLRFDFSSQPVPEPATMFLLGTGLVGLIGARRRRMSNGQS